MEVSGGTFFREDTVVNQYATESRHLIRKAGEDGRWWLGYTVTFNSNGGSEVNSQDVVKGGTVAQPSSTQSGYTLNGWNLDGAAYDFSTPVNSDITLTAQWSQNSTGSTSGSTGGSGGGGGGSRQPSTPSENPPEVDVPDPDVPLVDIPEVDPPLVDIPEEEPPLVELPEEEVPLADVPKTGDRSLLWQMSALLSAVGLMVLKAFERKQDDEA